MSSTRTDVDVVVIGSGFGGSVAALRLAEKGYTVTVLEAGRRFADEEFARTSWRLHRYLWAPRLRLFGIQRIHSPAGTGGEAMRWACYRPWPPTATATCRVAGNCWR